MVYFSPCFSDKKPHQEVSFLFLLYAKVKGGVLLVYKLLKKLCLGRFISNPTYFKA